MMGYAAVAFAEGHTEVHEQAARYAGGAETVLSARELPAAQSISTGEEAPDSSGLDALEELGDEIATLAAHLHAATHRLLTLIADFDRLGGWKLDGGFRSCAHWLAFRTGINLGAAREKVRAARALGALPQVSASMARGELSFTKVRALTRVATPANEAELLELARAGTAAGLEKVVRAWRLMDRLDEAELERVRHRTRCFSVFPDDDGMYVVRGRLDPEVGAALIRAVEAASDALYRSGTSPEGTEAKQRRADAVGLLAERALAAGFGGEEEGASPISGSRAERYQIVLHVDAATLQSDQEPGRSELEDGTRVSAETSRRLACDSGLVRIGHAAEGGAEPGGSVLGGFAAAAPVLDIGRKSRTVPPALRRALESRDGGCRFPGCGLRFTDAHHVKHWADGGETKLANLVLLCRFHHRAVHEEGYRVDFPVGGRPNFYDPRGRPLPDAPPPARLGTAPTRALVRQNHLRGARPDFWTSRNGHIREDDVPGDVFIRAMNALEGADRERGDPEAPWMG